MSKSKWSIRWRGGEFRGSKLEEHPRIERTETGYDTKRLAVEGALRNHRKRLEDARKSLVACQRYVEQLEALLKKAIAEEERQKQPQ